MPETVPGVDGSDALGLVDPTPWTRAEVARTVLAALVLVAVAATAWWLHDGGRGSAASFSLLTGAALGVLFERGRFCFFCITRDLAERRDSTGVFAILAALATGAVGYAVVLALFLPDATGGRLPPEAHVGPVSPALALAALVFGIGVVLSHGCLAGHLYRLGEGSVRSGVALLGALVGFGLGFASWNTVYLRVVSEGLGVLWLPEHLGYAGSLLVTLAVLAAAAAVLLRWRPADPPRRGGRFDAAALRRRVLVDRWPPVLTGSLVGLVGAVAYLRVEPLGVTAQWGSISRTVLDGRGLLPETLVGLDTFAGCATVVLQTVLPNGWLIGGIVVASFAAALAAGRFGVERVSPSGGVAAALGGVLLGWGSMTALGCTVGVLLSGTQAFAVSGWVFLVFFGAGLALAYRLRLQDL